LSTVCSLQSISCHQYISIDHYRTGCALIQTFTLYEGVIALGRSDDATRESFQTKISEALRDSNTNPSLPVTKDNMRTNIPRGIHTLGRDSGDIWTGGMSKKTDGLSSCTFEPLFVLSNAFIVTGAFIIDHYAIGCVLMHTFTWYEGVYCHWNE
jgi:hypothetical protein